MKNWFFYLYNVIAIPIIWIGFIILTPFNQKIKQGRNGRKNLFQSLERDLVKFSNHSPRIWIHNSSMGEFEQAKPIIQALKAQCPNSFVIVSFFSPSGFEHAHNTSEADYLCYLPFDSLQHARKFIQTIQPDVAIVVRHDFWPNHLWTLKKMRIPSVLINCSIGTGYRYRIKPLLHIERSLYQCFDAIFTVSELARERCLEYRFNSNVTVAGDTRYDQVIARASSQHDMIKSLKALKKQKICFVLGSTWPGDENTIFQALSAIRVSEKPFWLVVVPHEPTKDHLVTIEKKLDELKFHHLRLSEINATKLTDVDAIVVDRIGILANLYALADLAYVGGGFGVGVHSVLEPAAFGKIVIYGPNHLNSYEAIEMEKTGIGFSVRNATELEKLLTKFLVDPSQLDTLGNKAKRMVQNNLGASDRISKYLCKQV